MSIEAREGFHKKSELPFDFGKKLIAEREISGFSQAQAARHSELSQGYCSQLENNEISDPSYDTVISVSRALGLPLNFFNGSNDTRAFLKPQAARVAQLIAFSQDEKKKIQIKKAIKVLIPDVKAPHLSYVGLSEIPTRLSQALKDRRKNLDMSQGELAKKAKSSQGYLSQIENEKVHRSISLPTPSFSFLRRIAKALKVDNILYLVSLERKQYPQEVKHLDRFLRSDEYTPGQKKTMLSRLINVVSMIQPLVNELDATPERVRIS